MTLDAFISHIAPWGFILLVIGALVDIVQAFWIFKKLYRKMRRLVYNEVRKQVLEDMRKDETK